MSRPVAEVLSRFTPDGSGLDRDALLIAVGRASVRPNRSGWIALAACLAVSQVLTLVALWPQSPLTPSPVLPGAVLPSAPESVPATSLPEGPLTLWPRPDSQFDSPPRAIGVEDLQPDAPPLRAFTVTIADVD